MTYFVVYEIQEEGGHRTNAMNVILKDRHPIEWAANPPPNNKELGMITYLLWWRQIPKGLIETAKKWCTVEQ